MGLTDVTQQRKQTLGFLQFSLVVLHGVMCLKIKSPLRILLTIVMFPSKSDLNHWEMRIKRNSNRR